MSADLVIEILETFLRLRTNERKSRINVPEFLRIDIKLLNVENDYSIQVTNCGSWEIKHPNEILRKFHQFCDNVILKNEIIFFYGEIHYTDNEVSLKACTQEDTMEFPHLKEYLSIKLKTRINSVNLMNFEEQVLQKIKMLKDFHTNVKFTYFRKKLLYTNTVELDNDYELCCLLSTAMTNVVKQSRRDEFRKKSFDFFKIQNYDDLELAIKCSLLQKIHNNYVTLTIEKLRMFQGLEKYF